MRITWLGSCLVVLVFALLPNTTFGKQCTKSEIAEAGSKLPSFLVIPPKQSARVMVDKTLGCSYPFLANELRKIRPTANALIGREVFGLNNRPIGEIDDLIIGKDYQIKSAIVASRRGMGADERLWMVPSEELTLRSNGVFAPYASIQDLASLEEFDVHRQNAAMKLRAGRDDLSYDAAAHAIRIDGSSWSRGLYPIEKISISLESKPLGASIIYNGVRRGRTSVRAIIDEAYVETLRFEMKGFATCEFEDGDYERVFGQDFDYLFRCQMQPAKN